MNAPPPDFQHYRGSTLGMALAQTLSDLVLAGDLSEEHANSITFRFDKAINSRLRQTERDEDGVEPPVTAKILVSGTLHTFRNVEDVWTWILQPGHTQPEGPRARSTAETLEADILKIVACDGRPRGKPH